MPTPTPTPEPTATPTLAPTPEPLDLTTAETGNLFVLLSNDGEELIVKASPTADVMRQGRWKSPTVVVRYTRAVEAGAAGKWL